MVKLIKCLYARSARAREAIWPRQGKSGVVVGIRSLGYEQDLERMNVSTKSFQFMNCDPTNSDMKFKARFDCRRQGDKSNHNAKLKVDVDSLP